MFSGTCDLQNNIANNFMKKCGLFSGFITIRRSARFYHFRKPFISIPKTDRLFKVIAYIRIRIIITYLVSRLYNKVIYLKTSVMMLEWYKFINDDENWVCQSISENNRNSSAFLWSFPARQPSTAQKDLQIYI